MPKSKIHAEVVIEVSPETVFNFLTNPNNLPLVLPGLIENYNIPELPIQKDSSFNYKYQMFGVMIDGELTIDNIEEPSAYDFTTTGGVTSSWIQRLTPEGDGTKFTLDVEYEAPASWLEKVKVDVAQKMNEGEAEKYAENLKTLLELQAQPD